MAHNEIRLIIIVFLQRKADSVPTDNELVRRWEAGWLTPGSTQKRTLVS
jgi:hypothetical protein